MGAIFLVSGYSKLYPIEPFEYTFVDLGFINWQIAPFVARFMIGLEFFIGILLVLNLNLRKFAYKLGVATLALFSIYLILLLVFTGNKGNCGCFGSYIEMTPLQALLKNIVMLGVFYVLHRWHEGWEVPKWNASATFGLVLFSFAMPFILNTVQLNYSEAYLNKPEENFKLELDTLYQYASLNTPPKTLSEGKHIIAFMSLTCPHCRIAANKIRIIKERNPNISFYFVLNGDTEKLTPFYETTHTENIPHCILVGGKPINHFVYLAGTSMPAIYMVNNSVVEHIVNYMDLDQEELEEWYEGGVH
jgi:uncharacterized membrane protein YphA (DoxX/SURF4 family)